MPRKRTNFVYCHRCGRLAPSNAKRFCSRECATAERTKTPEERFWPKVNKDGPVHPLLGTRCWLWTGSTDGNGYGTLSMWPAGPIKAHRFAWKLLHGELPEEANVLHRCDVRACVNAAKHLFLGTLAENNADMGTKGRARGASKLSDEQVRAIRAASNTTQAALSAEFGVSQGAISFIRHRKTYKHVQ